MASLFDVSEDRMWQTIAFLLAVTLVLLFASFQFPWYNAVYHPSEVSEVRGDFRFDEYSVSLFNNGQPGDSAIREYGSGAFGTVMGTTQSIISVGVVGIFGFLALLGFFYYGHVERPLWIVLSWSVGMLMLVLAIAYFSASVADAAVRQIEETAAAAGQFITRPEPLFWGSQRLSSGRLETSPGIGWLLSILAAVNLAMSLTLLFQFPEPEPGDDDGSEAYALPGDPGALTMD